MRAHANGCDEKGDKHISLTSLASAGTSLIVIRVVLLIIYDVYSKKSRDKD